jgi:hypothetical protein
MTKEDLIFEEKGYPTIKVYNDRISIKAIDYWAFREFKFQNIKSFEFYRPYEKGFFGFLREMDPILSYFRKEDDFIFRINLKDGENWEYNTTYKFSKGFEILLKDLQKRLATSGLEEHF